MPSTPRFFGLASATVGLVLISSCREEPPVERHYPMRQPMHDAPAPSVTNTPAQAEEAETEAPAIKRERPKPDPAIEAMLEIISSSGRRFIDQAEDGDSRPTEYTAEQFASMLRSKWDWLGYDIVEPTVWLDEIATRSFKSSLPYLVVLDGGTTVELRGWLDTQRAQAKP
jgi:hypothetical protein